ncbi:MAG: DUF3179 domain-containing protein, partial [Acidobacteria bacterium]|nr:DUF3179 domain-containing protein [Acidobacteriota bacterium]
RALTFGTSGLLYRSNKLMFDHETGSLWSSLEGKPVMGPLAAFDVELDYVPVYTTTWAVWRTRFPETTVLDIETGYQRDYSEGAAYRSYFATDELMFQVAQKDQRLPNKAEVLVFKAGTDGEPVAIALEALRKRKGLWLERGSGRLWVRMDSDGFCEVLQPLEVDVPSPEQLHWQDEGYADEQAKLMWKRLPSHRVFWFAWYAQHPDTELIH